MKYWPIISAICISLAVIASARWVKESVDGLAQAVRNQQINSGMPQRVEVSGLDQLRVDIESLPRLPTIKFESVPPKIVQAEQPSGNR